MHTVELPAFTVLSGPKAKRDEVAAALRDVGLTVVQDILSDGEKVADSHGLPSYPNPKLAKKHKRPLSGHTPGTQLDGEDYEDDPRISFLTVEGEDMNRASEIAEPFGWVYRMHACPRVQTVEDDVPVEDRLRIIEYHLKKITGSDDLSQS